MLTNKIFNASALNYKEKTITAKALFSSLSRDEDKAFAVIVYHV